MAMSTDDDLVFLIASSLTALASTLTRGICGNALNTYPFHSLLRGYANWSVLFAVSTAVFGLPLVSFGWDGAYCIYHLAS